jgi:hypothetical protein
MDGTEDLNDREYRAYHVVLQCIYLQEGPIKCNERGLAGRCNQDVRVFRKALAGLVDKNKLIWIGGDLFNVCAAQELHGIDMNRIRAGHGGTRRAERAAKRLKNKGEGQASLELLRSLKEKKRQ